MCSYSIKKHLSPLVDGLKSTPTLKGIHVAEILKYKSLRRPWRVRDFISPLMYHLLLSIGCRTAAPKATQRGSGSTSFWNKSSPRADYAIFLIWNSMMKGLLFFISDLWTNGLFDNKKLSAAGSLSRPISMRPLGSRSVCDTCKFFH